MINLDIKSPVPLYQQLKNALEGRIRQGIYPPGTLMPSISEILKSANVGRVTIVKTFEEMVKDGFVIAVQGKGHYVTEVGKSPLITLVAPLHGIFYSIYANLLMGMKHEAYITGHKVDDYSSDEFTESFIKTLEQAVYIVGARWIVAVPPLKSENNTKTDKTAVDYLKKLQQNKNIKLIVLDRKVDNSFISIVQNHEKGFKLLLERALKKKIESVLILDNAPIEDKKLGKSLLDYVGNKIKIDFMDHEAVKKNESIIEEIQQDLVLCKDDILARKIINKLGEKRNFKIAGYNGTASAFSLKPMITTVNSNLALMGELAIKYFTGKIEKEEIPETVEPFLMPGDTF